MARILVTGAAGFIGRALCRGLAEHGHQVLAGLRRGGEPPAGSEPIILGDIAPGCDWSAALRNVEVVYHLAQHAHRRARSAAIAQEPEALTALTGAAARAGVRRLVYFSSIKAMGETTGPGRRFRASDPPQPRDAYGRRKWASERALAAAVQASGIEATVLRPPLVYGPGAGANFAALIRLAGSGLPLPFAGIDNRRSLIFIDNLVELAIAAGLHPHAAGAVLLARDDADFSTPELVGRLADGLGRRTRLFRAPAALFAAMRRLPALAGPISALTLSLQIDDGATRAALGWTPRVPAAEGLTRTARAFVG